jgi:nucleoside-diphosphate-sugar epimerase
MTILVTGANGFLGKAVMSCFQDSGIDVAFVSRHLSDRSNFFIADLSRPEDIFSVLKKARPSAIINLAAAIDFSSGALTKMYAVNILLPALLSCWCAENRIYLLQASSILVNSSYNEFITLDTPEQPDTDYGISKLLAEKVILASGCKNGIIRFGGLFGRNGPSHLGLNNAIRNAATGTPPTIFGKGLAKRNYIYVNDAAIIIKHCIISQLTGIHPAGGLEVKSIAEMLKMLCDVYLNGREPLYADGIEAKDQIIETSPNLPKGRTFLQALKDDK